MMIVTTRMMIMMMIMIMIMYDNGNDNGNQENSDVCNIIVIPKHNNGFWNNETGG